MASRSNALAELTRFWLQDRHGCLVRESVPVRVHGGTSDLDFVAQHPAGQPWGGTLIPPTVHAIVETKAEHDYDPLGREFARMLNADVALIGAGPYAPTGTKLKFSMLRTEHFQTAQALFGHNAFARIFVVHALDRSLCAAAIDQLAAHGVYWITARELVADLVAWYPTYTNRPGLRHTLVGDLLHLLIGYLGMTLPDQTL